MALFLGAGESGDFSEEVVHGLVHELEAVVEVCELACGCGVLGCGLVLGCVRVDDGLLLLLLLCLSLVRTGVGLSLAVRWYGEDELEGFE